MGAGGAEGPKSAEPGAGAAHVEEATAGAPDAAAGVPIARITSARPPPPDRVACGGAAAG
jgi:hypothetical protein